MMPASGIFFFRVTVFSLNGKEIELLVPFLVCATDAKRSLSKAARPVDHLGGEANVWKATRCFCSLFPLGAVFPGLLAVPGRRAVTETGCHDTVSTAHVR